MIARDLRPHLQDHDLRVILSSTKSTSSPGCSAAQVHGYAIVNFEIRIFWYNSVYIPPPPLTGKTPRAPPAGRSGRIVGSIEGRANSISALNLGMDGAWPCRIRRTYGT